MSHAAERDASVGAPTPTGTEQDGPKYDILLVMSNDMSANLVTLDSITTESEVEILPNFSALVEGRQVWVTAVLERTAVVEPGPGEPKVLVKRGRCLVNPHHLRYGQVASRNAARRGREAARRNREAARQQHAA
jgi:hypothetical protein